MGSYDDTNTRNNLEEMMKTVKDDLIQLAKENLFDGLFTDAVVSAQWLQPLQNPFCPSGISKNYKFY